MDSVETTPPVYSQWKDHGELLDAIDCLRSQGVSDHVQLPQLIVCGDQSSDKSLILEAISGVRFSTIEGLCTRFAVELILRRDSTESSSVAIRPGKERTEKEKEKLIGFKAPLTELDDLPALLTAAEEAMGLDSRAQVFIDDVLQIKLRGPNQAPLTLVDLPSLTDSKGQQQSNRDTQMFTTLAEYYMENSRSIILAVLSAKNDYANHFMTQLARVDPKGLRNLGIVTRPESLKSGSNGERAFLDLNSNKTVYFRLGRDVLKNRMFDRKMLLRRKRIALEKLFFPDLTRTSFSSTKFGIGELQLRLNLVLIDQIIANRADLRKDIEKEIQDAQKILVKLGQERRTAQEQRTFLLHVAQSFTSLTHAALNGVYFHEFFSDVMDENGSAKRLRATVQNLLLEFADKMYNEGHFHEIVEDGQFHSWKGHKSGPKGIRESDFLELVRERMRGNRGCELPGMFNPLIVGDLFYHQAIPWTQILETYSMKIIAAARSFVELVLHHIVNEEVYESILRQVIEPAFEECTSRLRTKVQEILSPYQKGHPITYNHCSMETVQKARREHLMEEQTRRMEKFFNHSKPEQKVTATFFISNAISALHPSSESDMELFACSEAVECMQAYYKVALKVVIDNFGILAIENCVLSNLQNLFSPDACNNFEDSLIATLAVETNEARRKRRLMKEKLANLESGLRILNRCNGSTWSRENFALMSFGEDDDSPVLERDEPILDVDGFMTESSDKHESTDAKKKADHASKDKEEIQQPDIRLREENPPLNATLSGWGDVNPSTQNETVISIEDGGIKYPDASLIDESWEDSWVSRKSSKKKRLKARNNIDLDANQDMGFE